MSTLVADIREVVERKELAFRLGLEDSDFDRWLSKEAAAAFRDGESSIPPMPHFPGRPVKFDLSRVRQWRFRYFEEGGEVKAETKGGKRK